MTGEQRKKKIKEIYIVCLSMVPQFILQIVGLITPNWVSSASCDSVGLLYSCCSGKNNNTCSMTDGANEMDDRVLGLESTATLLMLFATLAALVMSAHPQKGADNLPWYFWVGGICIYIYPIAGILSVIGSSLEPEGLQGATFGYSRHLCLAAGCYVIFLGITTFLFIVSTAGNCNRTAIGKR